MIAKRAQAKKDRDFALADSIRDELAAKGIILKDTREGTKWSRSQEIYDGTGFVWNNQKEDGVKGD